MDWGAVICNIFSVIRISDGILGICMSSISIYIFVNTGKEKKKEKGKDTLGKFSCRLYMYRHYMYDHNITSRFFTYRGNLRE